MSDLSKNRFELPPEQQAIRAKCFHPSGTFIEFKKEEIEQSIAQRFEKMARMYPDRTAVKTRSTTLTYDALNKTANCIARAILAERGEGEEPLALLLENDALITASILGVLKTGKIYVPLDPSYPNARITTILQDTRPGLLITNKKNRSVAEGLARLRCRVLNVDEIDFRASTEAPGLSVSPDVRANILYTSGSTGQPKGVIQTHRNILHEIMNYTNAIRIFAADRLVLLSSPSFADAVRTTYGALLNGAGLYPLDLKEEGFAHLADWLIQQRITIFRSVPSVFRQLVNTLTGKEDFTNVRVIYSAGDSVSWSDIESYKRHFSPNCLFVNGLGSTESLTFRWYFLDKETPVTASSVPVGYPVGDKEVVLLDDDGNDAGFDRIGAIAVKSHYLSPGYWNRLDLTPAALRLDSRRQEERIYLTGDVGRMLPDGCLLHLGRNDFQIKIRGQRIEVAEIEMALLNLNMIKGAVVVAREDRSGDRRLVAYIVPKNQPVPTASYLRNALAEKLPSYMIPSFYVWLDVLPLTPNGKVDRLSLPRPERIRPSLDRSYAPPITEGEHRLVQIWEKVLDIRPIGVHDNFFDLGGHSLAATRVISRVIQTFQLDIPLRSLFDSPTVAEMAKVITLNQARKANQEKLERMLNEVEAMSDEEAERVLKNATGKAER
ncbi:MAG: non-ribosomal peptide synthetase [Deltaproteobacteria bacterium]|nr:non-ribosomal peptide synthetase [Deltaproteobacteria bacterium]